MGARVVGKRAIAPWINTLPAWMTEAVRSAWDLGCVSLPTLAHILQRGLQWVGIGNNISVEASMGTMYQKSCTIVNACILNHRCCKSN